MGKKKILIVNNNMHIGGVQRALVNLLKCVHDRYDITLVLFCPEGELMGEIPQDVHVLPVKSAYRFIGMTRFDVADRPFLKLMRGLFAAVSRIAGKSMAVSLMALLSESSGIMTRQFHTFMMLVKSSFMEDAMILCCGM